LADEVTGRKKPRGQGRRGRGGDGPGLAPLAELGDGMSVRGPGAAFGVRGAWRADRSYANERGAIAEPPTIAAALLRAWVPAEFALKQIGVQKVTICNLPSFCDHGARAG
jgi:hypothetical protein